MSIEIAVFASGGGSNLQALLDYFNGEEQRQGRVTLVVSDRSDAGALERARRSGVEARVIEVRGRGEDEIADEMLDLLREAGIGLVVLAGYLRLVPARVVSKFRGRILNIHPALLPSFGGRGMYGMRIHRAVIEAGCTVSGVTVHYVDERYDTGPILIQWPVPVLPHDSPEELAARVLVVEHRLLPVAVDVVAERIAGGGRGGEGEGLDGDLGFGLVAGRVPEGAEVRRMISAE